MAFARAGDRCRGVREGGREGGYSTDGEREGGGSGTGIDGDASRLGYH